MGGGQRAMPQATNRWQASSYRGGRCFFVGASLLAMRGGQRAMPQVTNRWQASSYRGGR